MNQSYNYFIEDGQFSFEISLGKLLGKEGDIIHLGVDGEDDYSRTYILAIEGFNVFCIGTIENSIPETESEVISWKEHWGVGGFNEKEYEVIYLAENTTWSPEVEISEVMVATSEASLRDQFRQLYPDCTIHRIVEL